MVTIQIQAGGRRQEEVVSVKHGEKTNSSEVSKRILCVTTFGRSAAQRMSTVRPKTQGHGEKQKNGYWRSQPESGGG